MKLPDKPSELIMLALKDLNVVEKLPGYVVSMSSWHSADHIQDVCFVCLAGSVMANSLKLPKDRDLGPHKLPVDIGYKLKALDYLRKGMLVVGLDTLGIPEDKWNGALDRGTYKHMPDYHDNKEKFYESMTKLANDLALGGL